VKIRAVKLLYAIVCSGASVWLFSQALNAVELTLEVGFICFYVVIDPTE
jgi:hypothetical protein